MTKRPAKPESMSWMIPYITVKDVKRAIEFYKAAFGFEQLPDEMEKDGELLHAEMRYRDQVIMFGAEGGWGGTVKTPANSGVQGAISLYVYCDDVDQLCARAGEVGAEIIEKPVEQFWGDRMCMLKDLDGHIWSFATNVAEHGPKPV